MASKGGIAYPSQATIAKNIGYSTRQVQRAIAGLAQVQAITIVYKTKQEARDAGISIKGDPVLDKDGAPVQENLNTMQVLFGWDGMCKKAISPQDEAVLNEHMKGTHDATGNPRAAKKPHIPADTSGTTPADTSGTTPADTSGTTPADTSGTTPADTSGTTPADTSGTTPADTSGTTPVTDLAQEHLTDIEHRLDRRNTNQKGSLGFSFSFARGTGFAGREREG